MFVNWFMKQMNTRYIISHLSFLLCVYGGLFGCKNSEPAGISDRTERIAIAFMPDVHFHDVFADFENSEFNGLPTVFADKQKSAAIRTMESQLTSTRLFNENYFAFIAALDDVVERGIKLVGLPGDFSDDGQPVHLRGLVTILNQYREEHGLHFFISPGNHDPGRPFNREAGKINYLGEDGRPQPIFSKNHPYCTNSSNRINPGSSGSQPQPHEVICTDDVKELGYEGLLGFMGDYGLYPNENYLYYETPFSSYDMGNYRLGQAMEEAGFSNRLYEICHEGSGGVYRKPEYTNCFDVMDMSYLAEPVEGLWLLAIDANVYLPLYDADPNTPASPANFSTAGNNGYNRVLTHKKHLAAWIEEVAERAEANNKTLIAFSHYPAVDFYNQARDKIEELWGEGRFQSLRVPSVKTSKALAASGLKLHVGGHMHMNDTGKAIDDKTGNALVNIQVPSLAAYIPAYKVIHVLEDDLIEVETAVLEEVPNFDTLFPHYRDEWKYLESIGYDRIWNREILESSDYYEFTDWHIRELSRLRFLPREWPEDVRLFLTGMNGRDMLIASKLESPLSFDDVKCWLAEDRGDMENITPEFAEAWRDAERMASDYAAITGLDLSEFENWNGRDLSLDFYRLRNADELALRDIPAERIAQYSVIAAALSETEVYESAHREEARFDQIYKKRFRTIFEVLHLFSNGLPAGNFLIDLKTGEVKPLSE